MTIAVLCLNLSSKEKKIIYYWNALRIIFLNKEMPELETALSITSIFWFGHFPVSQLYYEGRFNLKLNIMYNPIVFSVVGQKKKKNK